QIYLSSFESSPCFLRNALLTNACLIVRPSMVRPHKAAGARQKSVVQITTRFRKDLHRRLAQEAKARDISLNEEIERTIAATKAEKRQGTRLPCRNPGNPGPAMAAG